MSKDKALKELVDVVEFLLDDENCQIFPSAIELDHQCLTDFDTWEAAAKRAIALAHAIPKEML